MFEKPPKNVKSTKKPQVFDSATKNKIENPPAKIPTRNSNDIQKVDPLGTTTGELH
jgi:hypothetical protein